MEARSDTDVQVVRFSRVLDLYFDADLMFFLLRSPVVILYYLRNCF